MNKKERKNKLEYVGFKFTLGLFKLLPFGFGKFLLRNIIYRLGVTLRIRRKTIIGQIRETFPNYDEKKIIEIYKNTWKNFAITTSEVYLEKAEKIFPTVKMNNFHYVKEALSKGNGVILASGHFSNWELAALYLLEFDIKISVIIKKLRNDYINNYTNKLREDRGIEIIYMKKALRPMLKALKDNRILCMLIDQAAGKSGYQLPFLGRIASVHTGSAKIAIKTNSPIIVGISIRNEDGSYTLDFKPPIYPNELKEEDKNIKYITSKINAHLEDYIIKYPHLWFWHHKRWKGAKNAKKWE